MLLICIFDLNDHGLDCDIGEAGRQVVGFFAGKLSVSRRPQSQMGPNPSVSIICNGAMSELARLNLTDLAKLVFDADIPKTKM